MAKGVFNPFAPPEEKKQDFRSALDNNPLDTEFGQIEKPGVRLDGDSFILELKETELKEVPTRLGSLIKDVASKHSAQLLRMGINLIPNGTTYQTEATDAVLATPQGKLHVHIGDKEETEDTEVASFRRIAYALHQINVPDILEKHKAKLIVR